MDWACTAKTFLDVKLKNLMMTALKTFHMIAIAPHQHHQINKPFKKNLQPLKIKVPKQSTPPKCEKEKAMCKAKSEKEKQTCKTKNNLKRKLKNDEEVENKGFNIDGDMTKFLEHLDHHTKDLFQSTKEVLDENLPIIYNSLATVKSFISLLGKIIKNIPHEIDPISSEITLKCKGCLLHCPQNWSLTSPPG